MPYARAYRHTVTLTSKGQITLPAELRRQWNLQQGDRVEFALLDDERVLVRKIVRLSVAEVLSASRPAAETERDSP